MKLGLFTAVFNDRKLEECFDAFGKLGLQTIELYTGPFSPCNHIDVDALLESQSACDAFREKLAAQGLTISALNCAGNPVHPNPETARAHHLCFEKTVRLAERLGVEVVICFSGCPGGGPGERTPNWIGCPWPEEFLEMLDYQWNDVLVPYWKNAAAFAREHGITKIAIEMHPGFCVYNPETLLKLRQQVGDSIGVNFDPSHLIWQGIDLYEAVLKLRGCVYHVHAKDTFVNQKVVRETGNIDAKHYNDPTARAWTFCTVGTGAGADAWRRFITALRHTGYDGVVSMEHEDMLMSRDEGLAKAARFLKAVMMFEPSEGMWWA